MKLSTLNFHTPSQPDVIRFLTSARVLGGGEGGVQMLEGVAVTDYLQL